jgi:hypothetical protein
MIRASRSLPNAAVVTAAIGSRSASVSARTRTTQER